MINKKSNLELLNIVLEHDPEFEDLVDCAFREGWIKSGLDWKLLSLCVISAETARGTRDVLKMHVKAALGFGVTIEEIRKLLNVLSFYVGIPNVIEAKAMAEQAFKESQETRG